MVSTRAHRPGSPARCVAPSGNGSRIHAARGADSAAAPTNTFGATGFTKSSGWWRGVRSHRGEAAPGAPGRSDEYAAIPDRGRTQVFRAHVRRYLVEAKKRKLAIVKGTTAADMLANALFHAGHVRAELLRTYYEVRNSGDRPSVLRALSELRQHSRDEIALLERAGASKHWRRRPLTGSRNQGDLRRCAPWCRCPCPRPTQPPRHARRSTASESSSRACQ